MTIILIGNYPPDQQESMERFTQMLERGFRVAGLKTEVWRPIPLLGAKFRKTTSGLGKWMGYIDKWVIFPLLLQWRLLGKRFLQSHVRFHICDHSNAPYLNYLPADRTVITCHDVLAIRGAMGFADAYCEASTFGKLLQKWILFHLSNAKTLASVSQLTLNQLMELSGSQGKYKKNWCIIYNAFNADFKPTNTKKSQELLSEVALDLQKPYILHVGSGLPRKNRKMLLDMVHALGNQWDGYIYFAGQPLDASLLSHAKKLGLQDRVHAVVKPSHTLLVALYSSCQALIFPSFSEGFGWPVIEAQACGAPVIASNKEPMPEVSGGAAIHVNPYNPHEFAQALLSLNDEAFRADLIQRGFQNIQRFETAKIINAYLDLHQADTIKMPY